MRRLGFLALIACCPALTGCVVPCCALPSFDYTPSVPTASANEVHAFRVDVTSTKDLIGAPFALPEPHRTERLTQLEPRNAVVPAQYRPSLSYGAAKIPIIAPPWVDYVSHSVVVRLYRPGFELVELHGGDSPNVNWIAATTLDAQEKVLDKLLLVNSWESRSVPAAHQKSVAFIASEYKRLSLLAEPLIDQRRPEAELDTDQSAARDVRVRLESKALKLRSSGS